MITETILDYKNEQITFDVLGNVIIHHDAILDKASFDRHEPTRLHGVIYDDSKGRFEDGRLVITSPVDKLYSTNEGYYAVTKNTTYKLVVENSQMQIKQHRGDVTA